MESLTYVKNYLLAKTARTLVGILKFASSSLTLQPDEVIQIPSRNAPRTITAHIYKPKTPSVGAGPVLLNFHGSGFVLPMHGSDDAFCRYISEKTNYTVVDVSYRMAPENPFPAALNDVEDSIKWVVENNKSHEFDLSRLALSGFSAGANLVLAVASSTAFPKTTFSSVIAFYPPTDLAKDPALKVAPSTAGKPIPAPVARFFNQCYIPAGVDPRDPRVSPSFAEPNNFPDKILFVTCAQDSLAVEVEELAEKIGAVDGKEVVVKRMEECNHGWNLSTVEGSVQEKAKWNAYTLVLETLGV